MAENINHRPEVLTRRVEKIGNLVVDHLTRAGHWKDGVREDKKLKAHLKTIINAPEARAELKSLLNDLDE